MTISSDIRLHALAGLVRLEMDASATRLAELPSLLAEDELADVLAALTWLRKQGVEKAEVAAMHDVIYGAEIPVRDRASASGRSIGPRDPVAALNWIATRSAHRQIGQLRTMSGAARSGVAVQVEQAMSLLEDIGAQDRASIGRIRYLAGAVSASALPAVSA